MVYFMSKPIGIKTLFDEEVEKVALKYLQKNGGKLSLAAAELGIMNPTLRRIARRGGFWPWKKKAA